MINWIQMRAKLLLDFSEQDINERIACRKNKLNITSVFGLV